MNVASLENCKALYEVSRWDDTERRWGTYSGSTDRYVTTLITHNDCPAYDLSYVLQRLPSVDGYNDHWEMWRSLASKIQKDEWTIE